MTARQTKIDPFNDENESEGFWIEIPGTNLPDTIYKRIHYKEKRKKSIIKIEIKLMFENTPLVAVLHYEPADPLVGLAGGFSMEQVYVEDLGIDVMDELTDEQNDLIFKMALTEIENRV